MNQSDPTIQIDLFCLDCGYNLRGLTGNQCPECGHDIAYIRTHETKIPWTHRREIGWFLAFWKTVYFVLLSKRRLWEELCRPVDSSDARIFRRVTLVWIEGMILLLASVWAWIDPQGLLAQCWKMEPHLTVIGFLTLLLGLLAFFITTTRPPRSFSRYCRSHETPAELCHRAMTLSIYAAAPLAWLPVVGWLTFVIVWTFPADRLLVSMWRPVTSLGMVFLDAYLVLRIFSRWGIDLTLLARHALQLTPGDLWAFRIGFLLAWFATAAAIFFLIPLVLLYFTIIYLSLTG